LSRQNPAHAAINDSVNLAVRAKKTSAKGFVNAVLRTFARENTRLNFADEIERISVETSHPRWLIERWTRQFGFADAAKLASVNNETPTAVFRLTAKSYANTLTDFAQTRFGYCRIGRGFKRLKVFGSNEILRAYVAEGKIYFQDEASQLVARIVALEDGESFLDVCAAPGSKTTLIANLKSQISKSEISFSDFRNEIRYPKSEIQNPISPEIFMSIGLKLCRRIAAGKARIRSRLCVTMPKKICRSPTRVSMSYWLTRRVRGRERFGITPKFAIFCAPKISLF
jgi:hypothetical protein